MAPFLMRAFHLLRPAQYLQCSRPRRKGRPRNTLVQPASPGSRSAENEERSAEACGRIVAEPPSSFRDCPRTESQSAIAAQNNEVCVVFRVEALTEIVSAQDQYREHCHESIRKGVDNRGP